MSKVESQSSALGELLKSLSQKMPTCDAQRAKVELNSAPQFSIFSLFEPNEVRLSKLIADLIDPHGSHGQGPIFLNAFLSAIGCQSVSDYEPVFVTLEYLTRSRRRIDILVETQNWIVGVENKPWAGQQENQLEDYLQEVSWLAKRKLKKSALVFLSDQDEKSAEGGVIKLPYYDSDRAASIRNMLTVAQPHIVAPRVRQVIDDFLVWIDLSFGEATVSPTFKPYIEAVEDQFEKSAENRKALGAVMMAHARLHERVIDAIGEAVLAEFKRQFGAVECKYPRLSIRLAQKDCEWLLRSPSWPKNCSVGIAAEQHGYKSVYYGVVALDPKSQEAKMDLESVCGKRTEIQTAISRDVGQGRKSTPWWAWWKYLPDSNWSVDLTARLLLEAETVDQHPDVKWFAGQLIELAGTIDKVK